MTVRNQNALDGLPRSMEEWSEKNDPVAGIAKAWADIRELADRGNPAARALVKIDVALKEKKAADNRGEAVPEWARETLSFLDCYRDDEAAGLDEAINALKAAIN